MKRENKKTTKISNTKSTKHKAEKSLSIAKKQRLADGDVDDKFKQCFQQFMTSAKSLRS